MHQPCCTNNNYEPRMPATVQPSAGYWGHSDVILFSFAAYFSRGAAVYKKTSVIWRESFKLLTANGLQHDLHRFWHVAPCWPLLLQMRSCDTRIKSYPGFQQCWKTGGAYLVAFLRICICEHAFEKLWYDHPLLMQFVSRKFPTSVIHVYTHHCNQF